MAEGMAGKFGIEIQVDFQKASEVQKKLETLMSELRKAVKFDIVNQREIDDFANAMKNIGSIVDNTGEKLNKGFENINLSGLKEALQIIKDITKEQDKLDSAVRDNTFTSRKRAMSQKAGSVNSVLDEFIKEAGISKGIQSKVKAMIQDAYGNGTISEGFNEVINEELAKLDKDAIKNATKAYVNEFGEAFDSLKGKQVNSKILSMVLSKEEIDDFQTRTKGVIKLVTGTGEQIEQLLRDFNETYKGTLDLDGKVIQDQIMELSKFIANFRDVKKNGVSGVIDSNINEDTLGMNIIEKYINTIKELEKIEIRRATKGGVDVDEERLASINQQTTALEKQFKILSENEKAIKGYFENMGIGFDKGLSNSITQSLNNGNLDGAIAIVQDKVMNVFNDQKLGEATGEELIGLFDKIQKEFTELAKTMGYINAVELKDDTQTINKETEAIKKQTKEIENNINAVEKSNSDLIGTTKIYNDGDTSKENPDVLIEKFKNAQNIVTTITSTFNEDIEGMVVGTAKVSNNIEANIKAQQKFNNELSNARQKTDSNSRKDYKKESEEFNRVQQAKISAIQEFSDKSIKVIENLKKEFANIYDGYDTSKLDEITNGIKGLSFRSDTLYDDIGSYKERIELMKEELSFRKEIQNSISKSSENQSKRQDLDELNQAKAINKGIEELAKEQKRNIEKNQVDISDILKIGDDKFSAIEDFRSKNIKVIEDIKKSLLSIYDNYDTKEISKLLSDIGKLSVTSPNLNEELKSMSERVTLLKEEFSIRVKMQDGIAGSVQKQKNNEEREAITLANNLNQAHREITEEIERQNKKLEQQQKEQQALNNRTQAYMTETMAKLERVKGKYGSLVDEQDFQRIKRSIESLNGEDLTDLYSKVKMVNASITELTTNAQNSGLKIANQDAKAFGTTLKDLATKLGVFRLVNDAWNLIERSFRNGIQSVKDLDSAFTTLKITMDGMSDAALNGMLDRSKSLAQGLSATTSSVLEAVKTFANAQETIDSIMSKTSSAVILSNLTGLDTSRTVNIVQSAMQQFDALADGTEESAMRVADSMVSISRSLGMDFAQGISEMGEGIEIMGSLSNQLGMTLEDTLAMLASVMEKTRLSGSEVATAINFSGLTA